MMAEHEEAPRPPSGGATPPPALPHDPLASPDHRATPVAAGPPSSPLPTGEPYDGPPAAEPSQRPAAPRGLDELELTREMPSLSPRNIGGIVSLPPPDAAPPSTAAHRRNGVSPLVEPPVKRKAGVPRLFRRTNAGTPAKQAPRPRAAAPRPSAPPVPAAPQRAIEPVTKRVPVAAAPARRAMQPLPWGRDYAAAVVHRDDSLTAILGKLDAADSPRVVLVALRGSKVLSDQLGMRRLRRYVDQSGKDVIIVTHSGAMRARAHDVGLAVRRNVKGVDFARYGRSGLGIGGVTVPLPGLGLLIRLAAIALAVAAIVAAVLVYLPEATITIYPTLTPQSYTADITLLGTAAGAATASQIPAHRRSETITRTVQFPVHGATTIKGPNGADQQVPAATDDDLKAADAFAQQVLLTDGRQDLAGRYPTETFVQQSATVSAYQGKANVKAGDATDLVQIAASAQLTALSADNDTLRALAESALRPNVLRTQMFVPQTFKATVLSAGSFDKTNNQITARLQLDEATTALFSAAKLRDALDGKSRTAALQTVEDRVDESAPPKISVQPGWAPWLPRFSNRITVKVQQQPSPTPSSPGSGTAPAPTPTPAP